MVLISVYGSFLGPDLQCFMALALVFVSIAAHLGGKPYDNNIKRHRILDKLEVISLCVSWATFWSGLLFFLGKDGRLEEDSVILVFVSIVILGINVITLVYAMYHFGLEYMEDNRIRKSRLSMSMGSGNGMNKAKIQFLNHLDGSGGGVKVTPSPEYGYETEVEAESSSAEIKSWKVAPSHKVSPSPG